MGRGLLVQLGQETTKRQRSWSPPTKPDNTTPPPPDAAKGATNESEAGPSKRSRVEAPTAAPPTLHQWLHPGEAPRLMAHSPPLHDSTSTFLAFSLSFEAPLHVTSEMTLAKECRRIVRELNVPAEVGHEVMIGDDGAFQDGEGRVTVKGKERCREPDHRMWAVRTLCLKEGRDGTKGEGDYQLLECLNDDGEKYGGERVLKVMQEQKAVDVLTICCRWYGGDLLGPIRFQHIGLTARTSIQGLLKSISLRDLRAALSGLDEEIATLRSSINAESSQTNGTPTTKNGIGAYEDIDDITKLERLVKARERTKSNLESRAAWGAMEQAKSASAS